jgi:GrpB-like predicted nucleotidyltransferase (UPF0157 family)
MPPPFPVVLAEYDPAWPGLAAYHAERLAQASPIFVAVHHIGSTSVPGMAAKPIIDLMPLVRDLTPLDRERERLEALGYGWHGAFGMPGRRYCTLDDVSGARVVQLHCFRAGSSQARRHLAFREYLRAHPQVARAYATEKRRARDLHPDNSHAYGNEKSAWIATAEAAALAWHAARDPAPDESQISGSNNRREERPHAPANHAAEMKVRPCPRTHRP